MGKKVFIIFLFSSGKSLFCRFKKLGNESLKIIIFFYLEKVFWKFVFIVYWVRDGKGVFLLKYENWCNIYGFIYVGVV